ncbi:MAG: ACP S-malonyltransferase [Coriobacteriaceae bacterium]|nr:ACP S-malonyltransferase [Coriobacteriaceae bacterium]
MSRITLATSTSQTKTAWIYAGQGAQRPEMGLDIYREYPQIRPLFESEVCGRSLVELCFEASVETLSDTRYSQPCMAVFAAAVTSLLMEYDKFPNIVAGLSLGEYSALHAAGVFDAQTLIDLLTYRGAIMSEAYGLPSRMTAVFGLDDQSVTDAVARAGKESGGIVACANFNCPGQVVISGNEKAVLRAEELLRELGARRCVTLATSGPFHTPLMQPAASLLANRLENLAFSSQQIPVIFNVTAATATDNEVKPLLVRQLYSPVHFAQSLLTLRESGVERIIEIGPGRTLAGLAKRTIPQIPVTSIDSVDDLKEVIAS